MVEHTLNNVTWFSTTLREACDEDGTDINEVLRLCKQVGELMERVAKVDTAACVRIARLVDGLKRGPYENLATWYRLVDKVRKRGFADGKEDNMLYMVTILVMYEGLYAKVIDVLYEAVKVLDNTEDSRSARTASARCGKRRGGYISTGRKEECLRGEGVGVLDPRWRDVRNKAAHLNFVLDDQSVKIGENGKCTLLITDEMSDIEVGNVPDAGHALSMADAYSEIRKFTAELYRALFCWRVIYGGIAN